MLLLSHIERMAKGYWSIAGTITNPEGMGPFLQAFEAYLAKCGARFLCRDLKTDVREGNAGHLTVIIESNHWPQRKLPMRRPNTKRCSSFGNLTAMSRFRSLKKAITPVTD